MNSIALIMLQDMRIMTKPIMEKVSERRAWAIFIWSPPEVIYLMPERQIMTTAMIPANPKAPPAKFCR